MLSFANNKPVKIFSKGAGSNPDLWGVMVSRQSDLSAQSNVCFTFQIDGRRGYVNKGHIQEQRVYKKDLQFTVPTEFFKGPEEVLTEEKKNENEEKPSEEEIVINDSTENIHENIDKTKQLEDQQFETKNPDVPNPVEVKFEIFICQEFESIHIFIFTHNTEHLCPAS